MLIDLLFLKLNLLVAIHHKRKKQILNHTKHQKTQIICWKQKMEENAVRAVVKDQHLNLISFTQYKVLKKKQ